jgi:type I restriction enzyme S subunit
MSAGVKKGYKQTEVGVIPEDWSVCPIADIAPLQRGFDLPSEKVINGPYPVVYSNGVLAFHKCALCQGPSVVTGRSGTLGKIHFIESDYWPHNTTLWVTRFNENSPRYIFYLFNFIRFERFASGSGVPTLNRNDAHAFRVALAPQIAEQEAIAEALTDADALIESLEQLIAKKRLVKQGAMQELLTGKKRLAGFSGEWEEKSLGSLGSFFKGKGICKDDVVAEGYPCIRYGEIYTTHNDYIKSFYSFISRSTASQSQRIIKGDLLFAGSGETSEEIGKCVAFIGKEEAYAGGDIVIFRPKLIDSLYFGFLLNHSSIAAQKAMLGQGDAVVHISANSLMKITVKFPKNLAEQTAIATILSDMDAEITALESRLSKARLIKQGMMQDLLTGNIRLV